MLATERVSDARRAVSRDWRRLELPELRAICQKGTGEIFLLSQYVYRPFTIHVTRLYALLGLGANVATIHSALAALSAAGALLWPSVATFLIAAVGLQLYFVLDHVDGELARLDAWIGRRAMTAAGAYFDFWVHFHSINLVFGAFGIGLAFYTGNVIWAVVGLLADNCLGNFPKLALARTMWEVFRRDPSVTQNAVFEEIMTEAVTDGQNRQLLAGSLTVREKVVLLAREALLFPGCLIVLSLALGVDALTSTMRGEFTVAASSSYLVAFALTALASKLRRTRISMDQLARLTRPS